ncbi:MAG: protein phosphatase 2C domain-containing protein [Eubacteriales bacterium]|nr:protein phosphatase 2C domain-containing protein [Eubacteriales bacterium]
MITCATIWEKGDREQNEDFVGTQINGNEGLFVLADGLGGHGKGEVASRLVVETALQSYRTGGSHAGFLGEICEQCQNALLQEQRRVHATMDMKTTFVACSVSADSICWVHVGDSRLYLFERGRLRTRTTDHSVVQMLVYAGEIKEKEIRFHPDRNRLLKVMGTEWEKLEYECSDVIDRRSGQALLLCSDGFWELIDEKKMEKCLKAAGTVQEWAQSMQEIVLRNGQNRDMDNYSAVCIWCS